MKLTGDRCRCAGPPYNGCGEYFNSTYSFDLHRTGDPDSRRCLTVAEMEARGMSRNAAGFWITKKFAFQPLREGELHEIGRTPGTDSAPGAYPRASGQPDDPANMSTAAHQ